MLCGSTLTPRSVCGPVALQIIDSIPGDTKGKVLLYLHIDRWAQPLACGSCARLAAGGCHCQLVAQLPAALAQLRS